jgi:hypothetical protein
MSLYAQLEREDPTPWLLESAEPQARWIALAHLPLEGDPEPGPSPLGRTAPEALLARSAAAAAAHADVLAHSATRRLLDLLSARWDEPADVSGHNRPELVTNVLDLLAEFGVGIEDDPRIGALLEAMLSHADTDGCLLAYGAQHTGPPVWSGLHCDTHAIADAAGRFGLAHDPRVRRALEAAGGDLIDTAAGRAWGCRPDPVTGFRGPGRAGDPCPQATLEALRAFAWQPPAARPPWLAEAAHAALEVWRQRGERKPYMMGHGRQFKTVKWPPTWYGAYEVVDTLARLPETWRHSAADRTSLAEVAACLLAYNVSADGRVTPQSVFKGWDWLSFGQKKQPSQIATAMVWRRLAALEELAGEIASVDVLALASSKGGSGTPMPPRV